MAVIVKAIGLLLVVYALLQLPDRVVGYVAGGEQSGALLFGLVLFPLAVPLAVGAFLFTFPATVAAAVRGTQSAENPALERMLQAILFSGIGAYTALQSALNIVYYLTLLSHTEVGFQDVDPTVRASVIANAIGLVVGIAIVVGARGAAALVAKIRNGS
jgi:hypothetical protein